MAKKIKAKPKQNKKQSTGVRPILIVISLLLVVYLGAQIYSAFSGSIETASAVHITANDSFAANGWFFRTETTVSGSESSTVKHIVYSGERVQQDAALATVYADEQTLSLSRELEEVEGQIATLDAALQTAGDGSDAAKLDQLITLNLQQMTALLKSGSGTTLAPAVESLRSLSLKRDAGNLDAATVSAERDALTGEQQSLSQQVSGRTNQITSPASGYFSEIVDGYESILNPDQLEKMTVEEFQNLTETKPVRADDALGKIMQGFSWYLAAEVPVAEADRLAKAGSVRVNFTRASIETAAPVFAINKERDAETALIVLEGNEFNSEMVSMRDQPIDIILGTYTGLKVPKEAARMMTDSEGNSRLGVFILSGSVTKFKNITPLFETDSYYVVEQSATDASALVAQDKIIVRGKGLQNNMVVNT